MLNHIYTTFIENELQDFVSDEELENRIEAGDTESLEKTLSKMQFEPLIFEKYLYQYLFEKFLSDHAQSYEDIPEEIYYETIQKQFAKNGLKGKGSLDFSISTPLNKLKSLFTKPSTQIDRLVIYLFAYGLGMTVDELQHFIRKALWQPAVNLRDYKEVIYYWCLKNDFGNDKISKIQELLSYYLELKTENLPLSSSIGEQNTQELLDIFDKLRTEDSLKDYLKKLKISNSKKSSRSIREEFHYNLSGLVRNDSGSPENMEEGEKTDKEDADYSSALSCQKIVDELEAQRVDAYDNCHETLLDAEIASWLFKDVYWTHKSLQNRFDGSVMVSRNEFLLSLFLIYAPELSEMEFRANSIEELRYFRYDDFREEANSTLEFCNMMPLYPRNPFELFLFICLFHDKPYEYLLANWQQAILFNKSTT